MANPLDERFPQSRVFSGRRIQTARQEWGMRAKIVEALRSGPKTIPQVAEILKVSASEANWWMMGAVRYGAVRAGEKPDADGYYLYSAVEGS